MRLEAVRWRYSWCTRESVLRTFRGCLRVFHRRNEPLPTDRKTAAGLSSVIELKNESVGDIERSWQGNHWKARPFGRRWRIVLDHGRYPLPSFCTESRSFAPSIQTLVPRPMDPCCERHGRIRGDSRQFGNGVTSCLSVMLPQWATANRERQGALKETRTTIAGDPSYREWLCGAGQGCRGRVLECPFHG